MKLIKPQKLGQLGEHVAYYLLRKFNPQCEFTILPGSGSRTPGGRDIICCALTFEVKSSTKKRKIRDIGVPVIFIRFANDEAYASGPFPDEIGLKTTNLQLKGIRISACGFECGGVIGFKPLRYGGGYIVNIDGVEGHFLSHPMSCPHLCPKLHIRI